MRENEDAKIVLMLGYLCVSTEPEASLVRKVQILDRFDLKDSDIAKICDRPIQSVRNARLAAKRKNA